MEFVRGPCPNGYNWYVCAQFGYLGCCSKDACSVGGCPPGSEYPIDSPSQISSLGNVGDVQSNAGNSGGSGLGGSVPPCIRNSLDIINVDRNPSSQQTGSPSTTVKISPATPTTSSTATRLLSSGTTTAVIQPSLASTSSISVLLITPGSSPSKTTSPEQSAVGTGTGSGAASATTSGLSSGTGSGSNSDSNSNNTNSIPLVVIIGAAIGGALLILIIILAVILFRRRRRKAKNPPQVPPIYGSGPAPLPNDGAIKAEKKGFLAFFKRTRPISDARATTAQSASPSTTYTELPSPGFPQSSPPNTLIPSFAELASPPMSSVSELSSGDRGVYSSTNVSTASATVMVSPVPHETLRGGGRPVMRPNMTPNERGERRHALSWQSFEPRDGY